MFAIGQQPPASPRTFGERFVLRAIRTLHSAEATYASTYGNGIYGSLAELEKSQFIGPALATGNVYGYAFTVSITPYSTTSPPRFTVTATPNRYRRTGLRSFFIDDTGVIRGSDHAGGDANENDPEIGPCMVNDPSCYENFSIASLRTLHGAEFTFQATNGNGNFGTLLQLAKVYPLSPGLASGVYFGYAYTVNTTVQSTNTLASFMISAVPVTYGVNGFRSFFIDTSGVIRGADHNGGPADENDPPINQ